jgi:hypothetical protein
MNERHDRLTGHISPKDQHIHFVKFPRVQKLVPANIRTMNICRKKQFGHGGVLRKGFELARSGIAADYIGKRGRHGNK